MGQKAKQVQKSKAGKLDSASSRTQAHAPANGATHRSTLIAVAVGVVALLLGVVLVQRPSLYSSLAGSGRDGTAGNLQTAQQYELEWQQQQQQRHEEYQQRYKEWEEQWHRYKEWQRQQQELQEQQAAAEKEIWDKRLEGEMKRDKEVVIGDERFHPSFGVFPRGCKWRMVTSPNSTRYQWWDEGSSLWLEDQPQTCSPRGFTPAEAPATWDASAPRSTRMTCDKSHCMYNNLYYNNGRWYALLDTQEETSGWRFSRNQQVITLHVDDVRRFTESVPLRVIPGDTILFDFIFFTHPTAIGHWWEMLGPLFSILKRSNIKRPCDQFILLHLHRKHVLEWVRAMIAVALGVEYGKDLPPVYMQEPSDSGWKQLTQILEGFERGTWYMFEHVAITKDLYTGGGRTFLSRPDAQEFRSLVYRHYGLPPPQPRASIPHIITYQRKRANRRVLNEDELIDLLKNYGQLEVVEYDSSSSLYEQLLQMRKTGVYVSVHTSNLANAPLLQPGSAVFELLHRNWHWNGLDTSFRDQTLMMGDIHHYAWRAQYLNQTVYLDERDYHKVAHWPASQCGTEECVEAHTRVDLYVDIPQVKALLESRLPLVWANTPVYYAMLPWPPALDIPEDNVIPLEGP